MSKTAMSHQVRTLDGRVTTIAQLADEGLITFTAERVETRKIQGERHVRDAYFATMPDGGCWEISRAAYLSRTGQKVTFEPKAKPKKPAWIW